MADSAAAAGLGSAEPLRPPALWLQVSASVYDDAVAFKLSRLRSPGGRIEVVTRDRYPRTNVELDAQAAGSLALSWWVDHLDLTGRWGSL